MEFLWQETLNTIWSHKRIIVWKEKNGQMGISLHAVFTVFIFSLQTNVLLQSINLSWNGFGSDGAKWLGEALKANSVLEELDIS